MASAALAQQQIDATPAKVAAPPAAQRVAQPAQPVETTSAPYRAQPAASGEPRHELLSITAPSNGSVEVVYVRVGDHVDAGQALLTFNDHQAASTVSQLRLEIASARARAVELERSVRALDAEIAAATAKLPAPIAPQPPPEAAAIVARAQAIYNEAVARERRAAALQAHGIAAAQELEAAQMAVRSAADDLALARREADAKAALETAQVLDARTQADAAVASQRGQHEQLVAEIAATRQKQREAEAALVEATADSARLVVRAPAAAIVTELAVQPGDRTRARASLLTLDRIPNPPRLRSGQAESPSTPLGSSRIPER